MKKEIAVNITQQAVDKAKELVRLARRSIGLRIEIKKGDFWLTPGNVDHGIEAGENGAKVMDIFSPPRDQYKKSGSGFGV